MGTTFGSFEEFWAASSLFFDRLKRNAQIARNDGERAKDAARIAHLREAQEVTNQQLQATDARLDRLVSTVATLAGTLAKISEEIESHERRLGRLEGHPD